MPAQPRHAEGRVLCSYEVVARPVGSVCPLSDNVHVSCTCQYRVQRSISTARAKGSSALKNPAPSLDTAEVSHPSSTSTCVTSTVRVIQCARDQIRTSKSGQVRRMRFKATIAVIVLVAATACVRFESHEGSKLASEGYSCRTPQSRTAQARTHSGRRPFHDQNDRRPGVRSLGCQSSRPCKRRANRVARPRPAIR
jgi:hypothetical protein